MDKSEFTYYRQLELLGMQDELNALIIMSVNAWDEESKAQYIEARRAVNEEIHRIGRAALNMTAA